MGQKFTIDVGRKNFSDRRSILKKEGSNQFAQWHIDVSVDAGKTSMICILVFTHPSGSFVDLNITPKFICENSHSSKYNAIVATKKDEFGCFVGFAPSEGLKNGHCTFDIHVEIELPPAAITQTTALPSTALAHTQNMFETGRVSDITIIAEEKEIKAHNFFLSRSPIFNAMLNVHDTKEAREKVVKIEDIEYNVLVEMLRFMYTDQVPKMKEMACALLVAANKYDLPELAEECKEYLIKNVNVENFAETLSVADKLELQGLKTAAMDFFKNHRQEILSSDGWKKLKEENLKLVVEVLEKFAAE